MPNLTNEENWAARERLRRVEFLLWWRGWVGRQDLVEGYGISSAQASGDLQRYAGLNSGAMIYHTSRKRYEAAEGMACVLHEPSFEEAVRAFFGGDVIRSLGGKTSDERLDVLRLPQRRVDPKLARKILMALLERRKLRVKYLSVNSASHDWRVLVPCRLAWSGSRWHLRAWCEKNRDWRDFVLGRFAEADWPGEPGGELPEDVEWMTFKTVRLQINPRLSKDQQGALRLDYGLVGDTLEITVREAMKDYLLEELRIAENGHAELPRHFVLA